MPVPPGLPEPIPAPNKKQPPRGRDRALSSTALTDQKAPPPPAPSSNDKPSASKPPSAYEYAANEPAPAPAPAPQMQAAIAKSPPRSHLWRWLVVLSLIGIAFAITIPFTLGVYFGNQDRVSFVDRQAEEHFQRALAYESETYVPLAIAELELALKYKPDYAPAQAKLAELKNFHSANVEQDPQDVAIAKQLYSSAEGAIAQQDWDNAIDLFEELKRVKNDYRTDEVDHYLITAYLAAGKDALVTPNVDLARRRFDAALSLDPNNADAKTLKERAVLYSSGVNAMGTDWIGAIRSLEELYSRDPNFGDVKMKLRQAHEGYGEVASTQGAYCIAAREFSQAVSLGAGVETQVQESAANTSCKNAILNPTMTPTATPEGGFATPNPFGTPVPFETPGPGGSVATILFAPGVRVRQNAQCNGNGEIRGSVQDQQGNPIQNIGVKIYNDYGYMPPFARSDDAGEYEIALGTDKGMFHLVVVDATGGNASAVLDVEYPGGNEQGCHIVVNWTRIR